VTVSPEEEDEEVEELEELPVLLDPVVFFAAWANELSE
jgi:hypothetical protein